MFYCYEGTWYHESCEGVPKFAYSPPCHADRVDLICNACDTTLKITNRIRKIWHLDNPYNIYCLGDPKPNRFPCHPQHLVKILSK